MKVGNVVLRNGFDEHALPDAAAGAIPDVRGIEGLFAYGDDVAVCGVVDEDDAKNDGLATVRGGQKGDYVQLVMLVLACQIIGHINIKSRISATVEGDFMPVDKNGGFIIDSAKVE